VHQGVGRQAHGPLALAPSHSPSLLTCKCFSLRAFKPPHVKLSRPLPPRRHDHEGCYACIQHGHFLGVQALLEGEAMKALRLCVTASLRHCLPRPCHPGRLQLINSHQVLARVRGLRAPIIITLLCWHSPCLAAPQNSNAYAVVQLYQVRCRCPHPTPCLRLGLLCPSLCAGRDCHRRPHVLVPVLVLAGTVTSDLLC